MGVSLKDSYVLRVHWIFLKCSQHAWYIRRKLLLYIGPKTWNFMPADLTKIKCWSPQI